MSSPTSSSPEVAVAPADQLSERVSKMLHKIEKELDEVDASIGSKMHVLDTDDDGVISEAELLEAVSFLKEQLGGCQVHRVRCLDRDGSGMTTSRQLVCAVHTGLNAVRWLSPQHAHRCVLNSLYPASQFHSHSLEQNA